MKDTVFIALIALICFSLGVASGVILVLASLQ